jgi:hypothetical protein
MLKPHCQMHAIHVAYLCGTLFTWRIYALFACERIKGFDRMWSARGIFCGINELGAHAHVGRVKGLMRILGASLKAIRRKPS